MGTETAISWCDHTFNPWIGCTKITDGKNPSACDHCYAASLAKRWGWVEWGAGKPRKRTSPANWRKPHLWNKTAKVKGKRARVFCASLADWADAEIDPIWVHQLFTGVIRQTPDLEWLLLSKRHARVLPLLEKHAQDLPNIRVGFTVEDDRNAKIRLPYLREISVAGWPTFVSYEPAVGAVEWEPWMDCIDWLIAGGESGAGYRKPDVEWFRDARDACRRHSVPFHFKQWGGMQDGAFLDNREHYEFPASAGAAA